MPSDEPPGSTSMAPKLFELPVELLELVYSSLDKRSLRDVRLVCKHASQIHLRLFADAHFEQVNIIFSCSKSLKRALAVLQHPVFGPRVRMIAVYLDEYHDDSEKGESYKRYQASRQDLQDSGQDQALLEQIFQQAHKLGNLEDLKIETGYDNIYDAEISPVALAFKGYAEPQFTDAFQFLKVMQTIAKSSLHPKFSGMSVDKESYWSLPIDLAMEYQQFREDFASVLQSVRSLSMDVWTHGNTDRTHCRDFFRLIAGASHLQHLGIKDRNNSDNSIRYIRGIGKVHPDRMGIELFGQTFPALESLELRYINTYLSDLLSFLARNPNIARIKMVGVEIEAIGYGGAALDRSTGDTLSAFLGAVSNRRIFEADNVSKVYTI